MEYSRFATYTLLWISAAWTGTWSWERYLKERELRGYDKLAMVGAVLAIAGLPYCAARWYMVAKERRKIDMLHLGANRPA